MWITPAISAPKTAQRSAVGYEKRRRTCSRRGLHNVRPDVEYLEAAQLRLSCSTGARSALYRLRSMVLMLRSGCPFCIAPDAGPSFRSTRFKDIRRATRVSQQIDWPPAYRPRCDGALASTCIRNVTNRVEPVDEIRNISFVQIALNFKHLMLDTRNCCASASPLHPHPENGRVLPGST